MDHKTNFCNCWVLQYTIYFVEKVEIAVKVVADKRFVIVEWFDNIAVAAEQIENIVADVVSDDFVYLHMLY